MRQIYTFYFICIPSILFGQKSYLHIQVEAVDLSEDMNLVASGNDELIILIYYLDSTEVLSKPAYVQEFKFDEKNSYKNLPTGIIKEQESKILMLLLERDTERPVEQLDPVIRVYHKDIVKAYGKHDLVTIKKLLGDEDVLGTKIVQLPIDERVKFTFSGRIKMDKYKYRLEFD